MHVIPRRSSRFFAASALLLVLLANVSCVSVAARPATPSTGTIDLGPSLHPADPTNPGEPSTGSKISWQRVVVPSDVVATLPATGTWRINLIDVGTGLAMLIEGHDFAMLYDAGSNDREEKPSRVVAYLERALGPSGDDLCVDKSPPNPNARKVIDHVVLSHPHFDHASALDLVLHCYDAHDIWDSGRVNDTVFYRDFIDAIGRQPRTRYHTATDVPDSRSVRIKGNEVSIPTNIPWTSFHEADVVKLGEDARFTVLHAEGKKHPDPNQNSVVLLVELGGVRVLLAGDAESGDRADPSDPPGDVEAYLMDHFRAEIDVDILQVGHHGSKTSSRRGFLDAVTPKLALVSSGPKSYRGTVLPDPEVINALHAVGATVLRTDEHDASCDVNDRIGPADGPGGCDSYIITISK